MKDGVNLSLSMKKLFDAARTKVQYNAESLEWSRFKDTVILRPVSGMKLSLFEEL